MEIREESTNKINSSSSDKDNTLLSNSLSASQIHIVQSKNVDKNKKIELKGKDKDTLDTLFEFTNEVEDNYLILKLSEIDALAPFIYIRKITLEEMRIVHPMFKACDTLNDVKKHIETLFNNDRIKLSQKSKDKITFEINAYYISYEKPITIDAEIEMTDDKVPMLLKLYELQKEKLKLLKEIEIIAKNGNSNCKEITKKIQEYKDNIGN